MAANKHPKGLPYLFFAEMWERFGYYLMIGIFTLYLTTEVVDGGWGMEKKTAYDIYGTFIALVFLTPFLGGLLADRIMGYRLSITIGGLLMCVGYCLLAFKGEAIFFTALFLVILGNGFFKPNISTLLGNLYNEDKYRGLKDAGYNIFYMGINIGALICNFFAAALRNYYGWGAAFLAAGIGMLIGVIVFWIGMKHYKHADVLKPVQKEDSSLSRILGLTIVPAIIAGLLGWIIPGDIFGSDSNDAFILGAMPVVYFYYSIYKKATEIDKKPIGAMLAIFGVVIIFWAVFKQNGTALTTWAESYTDRELPAVIETPFETLKLSQNITYQNDSLIVSTDELFRKNYYQKGTLKENGFLLNSWGEFYTTGKIDSSLNVAALNSEINRTFWHQGDSLIVVEGYYKDTAIYKAGDVMHVMAYPDYFKNMNPEKIPAEGEKVKLGNTELFQSMNPFWVVVLTPLVVIFFGFMKKKGKEPSTPSKIAWGLVVSALSTFVMVAAVYVYADGEMKVSPWWLFASYGVITVGELFLSPMGLSLVSKLSPPRLTALMMGGWFLSTSIGNKLSGILATMWDKYDHKEYFFMVNFVLLALAALAIFKMLKWLNAIFKEHGTH